MNVGRTIFAQVMDFVSPCEFRGCVDRYGGQYKVKAFSCWDQFRCLALAQRPYRESLRDTQACLRVAQPKLSHMGFRSVGARKILAHANEVRDWRIYADFAQGLIATARTLYATAPFGVEFEQTVYALDSTVIDLCLALFPWATSRKRKGAVKLPTLLDLRGNIPTVCFVTPGSEHDVNLLDQVVIEAGTFHVFARAYLDFAQLYRLHQAQGFFVTRARPTFWFRYLNSHPLLRTIGVYSDQIIRLYNFYNKQSYPERLRRIRFFDAEERKRLVFLTNNFTLPVLTLAQFYKCRWQIEVFFKWLKHQFWIAIAGSMRVAIVGKGLHLEASPSTILQSQSVSPFEKMPLVRALARSLEVTLEAKPGNQLNLFK